jgi:hypothetical protein
MSLHRKAAWSLIAGGLTAGALLLVLGEIVLADSLILAANIGTIAMIATTR